jgi:hypothetical protein
MNAEEQIVAIHELCGHQVPMHDAHNYFSPGGPDMRVSLDLMPEYLSDRNLIIEAIKKCCQTMGSHIEFLFWFKALASGQNPLPSKFIPNYRNTPNSTSEWFELVTAPATVYCEALLRTFNKWQ